MSAAPVRVTVAGQTPPPFGGQAVMIRQMLDQGLAGVSLFHVRMAFSAEMDEIGKFRPGKVIELFRVIFRILYSRLRANTDVLYYPPAGPDRIPVYRDIAILLSTRWIFRQTVFHFHASGLSDLLPKLGQPMRYLAYMAYRRPDLAISLSDLNPPDGSHLGARRQVVIPYGLDDNFRNLPPQGNRAGTPTILFVGVLRESKGVLDLLLAAAELERQGYDFSVRLVGKFESGAFQDRVERLIESLRIGHRTRYSGVLVGQEKWLAYNDAEIFCFPTYFESESFGVVAVEAMQFSLPVVATRWKGLPSIVEDGVTGFLVPIRDTQSLAEKLAALLREPSLRTEMGQRGRERFHARFSSARFREELGTAFRQLGDEPTAAAAH